MPHWVSVSCKRGRTTLIGVYGAYAYIYIYINMSLALVSGVDLGLEG